MSKSEPKLSTAARARVLHVLETFLTEAAVLLAVFPVLDEFVQHGPQGVTLKLSVVSIGGAVLLLIISMLIAATIEE